MPKYETRRTSKLGHGLPSLIVALLILRDFLVEGRSRLQSGGQVLSEIHRGCSQLGDILCYSCKPQARPTLSLSKLNKSNSLASYAPTTHTLHSFHIAVLHFTMDSKYHLLTPSEKDDCITPIDSAAASYDQHDLDAVLGLEHRTYKFSHLGRPSSEWLWLLHAILLTVSITLFTLSVMVRSSTLKHVREFSAWCTFDTSFENLLE